MDRALAKPISSTEQNALTTFQLPETPGATVNIHDSSFVHVEGNANHYTFNPPTTDESGLQVLLQGIARDALYDSAERFPPPKCHPNTRTKILEEIETWINDANTHNTQHSVFWLHARAGEGKSAIMQSIAQKLTTPDGNIVATFFFGRGKGKRKQGHYLFSTIAYQIALNIPDLQPHINRIMQRKPTIPSSAMDFQVQFLFSNAFSEWKDRLLIPFTILVDGLDECNNHDDQQAILNLICEIVITHRLPLRFLIASRPEPQIREVFDGPILQEITVRATITDDFTSRMDLTNFLRDCFADIYRRKSRFIIRKAPGPDWPSDEVIEFLVSKSSGQFIYATTVVKFVDDKFRRPQEQLNIILSPILSQKDAFSYLDSLYMQILSTYPDAEALIRVLGFIVVMSKPVDVVIEDLLRVESGEVELILQGLHSVLTGLHSDAVLPEEDTLPATDLPISSASNAREVHIAHASFSDFLVDPRRSDLYYIDKVKYDVLIVKSAFAVLLDCISDSIQGNLLRAFSKETMAFVRDELYLNLRRLESLPESIFAKLPSNEDLEIHLGPDSSIPFAVFLAIDKLVTDTMNSGYENNTLRAERRSKLLDLKHRYRLFLYRYHDLIISREGHPFHTAPGLFAIRADLSSETLADFLNVGSDIIEKHWRPLGLHNYGFMLVETVNILRARYIVLHQNKDLCKKAERRNLDVCNKLLLRFFKRNWADTPEFSSELSNYIRNYFSTHLVGLIIVHPESDTARAFLDILDSVQIQCENKIDIDSSGKFKCKFKCIWYLLKAIFDWLSWQMEVFSKTGHHESFCERLRSTSDHVSNQMFLLIGKTELGFGHHELGSSNTPVVEVSDRAEIFRFIDLHVSSIVDFEHLASTAEAFFEVVRLWASGFEIIEEPNSGATLFEDVVLDYLEAFDTIIEMVEEGYKHAEKGKTLVFQFRYTHHADDMSLYIKFIKTIAATGQEIAETALHRLWNVKQKTDQALNGLKSTYQQGLEVTVLEEMLPYLIEETAKVLSWFVVGWRTMGIEEIYYLDPRPVAVELNAKLKMEILKDRYEEYSDKMGDLTSAHADIFKLLGNRREARPKLKKSSSSSIILFPDSDSDSIHPTLDAGNTFAQSVVEAEPIAVAEDMTTQSVQPDLEPLTTAGSDTESIQLDHEHTEPQPDTNLESDGPVFPESQAESSHTDSQPEITNSPPQREAEHSEVDNEVANGKKKVLDSEKAGCCGIQ